MIEKVPGVANSQAGVKVDKKRTAEKPHKNTKKEKQALPSSLLSQVLMEIDTDNLVSDQQLMKQLVLQTLEKTLGTQAVTEPKFQALADKIYQTLLDDPQQMARLQQLKKDKGIHF